MSVNCVRNGFPLENCIYIYIYTVFQFWWFCSHVTCRDWLYGVVCRSSVISFRCSAFVLLKKSQCQRESLMWCWSHCVVKCSNESCIDQCGASWRGDLSLPATLAAPCSCIIWPHWGQFIPLAGCNIQILLKTHWKMTILTPKYQTFSGEGQIGSTPSASRPHPPRGLGPPDHPAPFWQLAPWSTLCVL